jgi:hypothetical protein
MHVEPSPTFLEITAGQPAHFRVGVVNTSTVIDAYRLQVYGLDPSWVEVTPARLSLFPDDTADVDVVITLPEDYPAASRSLAVHAQSDNDPSDFALAQVNVVIAPKPRVSLRIDPVSVVGGSHADFALVVTNEGNTPVRITPDAVDPEAKVAFSFAPGESELLPARSDVIQSRVKGGRPWFGQPKARVLTFGINGPERVEGIATFVQKPRIGRGMLSLMGLVAAAAVFAAVLSHTFGNVVKEAKVDDRVLNEALANKQANGKSVPVDPAAITGKVVSFTSGTGIAGIQADLFAADDAVVPLATAATDDTGAYTFPRLSAGSYKVRFAGAGFSDIWYASGATFAGSTEIKVETGKTNTLPDVAIGGLPGSVKGHVTVKDPTGATATLYVTGQVDPTTKANVKTVGVSADGSFLLDQVPSPAAYQLVVQKTGFATEVRDVVVGAAEAVEGIEIVLREGDGVITGRIQDANGPLGGTTIEATDGTTKISTVSLTDTDVGFFALRSLPTPATYTVTISREGFRSETRTFDLASAQQLTDAVITLSRSTGSIQGTVSLAGDGPLGGVKVTVTGGDVAVSTLTVSQGGPVGTYLIENLPVPATYTVTFSRQGLVSQVFSDDLDPDTGRADLTGVDATLVPQTAVVRGVVRGVDGTPVPLATLTLTDGTNVLTLLSANNPLGAFEFANLAPGAYTLTASLPGTSPVVVLVNVVSSDVKEFDLRLEQQASLTGQVLRLDETTGGYVPFAGATVRLFVPANFPGSASAAAFGTTTDANGNYSFAAVEAPFDYVVAVYAGADAADPLDSELVRTQPSTAVVAPVFRINAIF